MGLGIEVSEGAPDTKASPIKDRAEIAFKGRLRGTMDSTLGLFHNPWPCRYGGQFYFGLTVQD